jgi:hypothetical protein
VVRAWGRAVAAGSAASGAYLLAQALDRRLVPNGYDDLILSGGLISRDPTRRRVLGLLAHCTLGIALAAAYDATRPLFPRLAGPVRGLLFAQAENLILYPGVPLLNAMHPAVRSGDLPSLLTWRYFWIEIWRHAAYGLVLGAASDR